MTDLTPITDVIHNAVKHIAVFLAFYIVIMLILVGVIQYRRHKTYGNLRDETKARHTTNKRGQLQQSKTKL